MKHLRLSLIMIILFNLVNCHSEKKTVEIKLKQINKYGCPLLNISINNLSDDSLFFPSFSTNHILKFYDSNNNDLTDSAYYLANRISGPNFFMNKTKDEYKEFISKINNCYDYDTVVKYKHYTVNSILIDAIELEYSIFLNINSLNSLSDSIGIKNYILQKYCPFIIIPPKISICQYVNLEDIINRYKTIKIVACIDYSNYEPITIEKTNLHNHTINIVNGVLEEINNVKRYNDIVLSDTIFISK